MASRNEGKEKVADDPVNRNKTMDLMAQCWKETDSAGGGYHNKDDHLHFVELMQQKGTLLHGDMEDIDWSVMNKYWDLMPLCVR